MTAKTTTRRNGAPYDGTRSKKRHLYPSEIAQQTIARIRTSYEEGKTISIMDLPTCVHRQLLMKECEGEARICVIACRRGISESWIAFAGYPDVSAIKREVQSSSTKQTLLEWNCTNVHDVEGVKMLGEHLEDFAAHELFPDWDINQYSNDWRNDKRIQAGYK